MKDANILIFGDSITYGVYDEELGGFVNRLKLDLERDYKHYYNVYNLGVPGSNTNDLLNRFENECKARLDDTLKTIIIFFIGINDSSYKNGGQNIKIGDYKNNISMLINKAKMFSNKIMFLGLTNVDESKTTPVNWDNNLYYYNDSIRVYDDVLKETCEKENALYLDLSDAVTKGELSDGLHPNANGHKKIEKKIIKVLKEIL